MNKLIAMELDGKLISAPKVRSVIGNDGINHGQTSERFNERRSSANSYSVNQKQK